MGSGHGLVHDWDWTLLIMVPEWLDHDMFTTATTQAGSKDRPPRLDDVRMEPLSEGRCLQTLHVGRFDDEADVLARTHHEFLPGNELHMVGKHHEIYLSDFRRVTPERLRTILRKPVGPV